MIIWGWSTKSIGAYATDIQCTHCQQSDLTLAAFQKFFNLFFIPTIPLSKEHSFVCTQCGTQFKPEGYNLNKKSLPKVKTPVWGFSGLIVILVLAVGVSILSAFEKPREHILPENLAVNDIAVIKHEQDDKYPYSLIKISKIDNGKLIFVPSKYAYASEYKAERAARRNRDDNFSSESYEVTTDDLKKFNITYIERP
jgi:hypothetical protein